MHVGLNLVYLVPGETGGMEVYARELIPELVAAAPQHRFTAFLNREAAAAPGPWQDIVETATVPVDARKRVEWVRGEQQLLPPAAQRAGVQLLHSLASTAPVWGRFRRVVTIHDVNYRIVPQAHPGVRALGMRVLVPIAARRSDRVIAISASAAKDLEHLLGVPSAKLDVVPNGLGLSHRATPAPERELRERIGAGERPIALSVSAKLAHKNLIRLIGAVASMPAAVRPLLVLPGYHTAHEERLRKFAGELGVGDDVRLLGWVSAEDLEGLYAAAACFVFPSLAEGFGLPVLEAMARGLPVACSNRGALAEVAGDAALLFDPESEPAIAGAIMRLVYERPEAEKLAAAGRVRAAQFSWRQAAAGTLASYERALAGPKST